MPPKKRHSVAKSAGSHPGGPVRQRIRRDQTDLIVTPKRKKEGLSTQELADGNGTGGTGAPPQWPDFGNPAEGAD